MRCQRSYCSQIYFSLRIPPLSQDSDRAMPFSTAAAASAKKRVSQIETNEVAGTPRPAKIPRASDVTILDGPRPATQPRRLPASAPVTVCIYKISDCAGDVWDSFQGQELPMWQAQTVDRHNPP